MGARVEAAGGLGVVRRRAGGGDPDGRGPRVFL